MDVIDQIRAFNRYYTGHLGLLSRSYLGSGLGLGEVRLLHELGRGGQTRARGLAQGLGMDEGQVSRVLAGFERRGWLERRPNEQDARQRDLSLTEAGQTVLAGLVAQSRAELAEVLAPLPVARQTALAQALRQVQVLLSPAPAPALRALRPGDMGWIISRHGAHYAEHEGFDASFEALVAEIAAAFLRQHDPARECGWIAAQGVGADEQRLGSIFCVAEGPKSPETAKLRLFYVEPEMRGTGLAQRMIETCKGFARGAGYRHMRLWTHESHKAAGRLYARNGFALTQTKAAHSFGTDVVEQVWERDL